MSTVGDSIYEQVEGRNPVLEALRGPRRVMEVYLAGGSKRKGVVAEIISEGARQGVPLREVPRGQIEEMAQTPAP